jgi:hypothetical protein
MRSPGIAAQGVWRVERRPCYPAQAASTAICTPMSFAHVRGENVSFLNGAVATSSRAMNGRINMWLKVLRQWLEPQTQFEGKPRGRIGVPSLKAGSTGAVALAAATAFSQWLIGAASAASAILGAA